jgi:hypothetical protein
VICPEECARTSQCGDGGGLEHGHVDVYHVSAACGTSDGNRKTRAQHTLADTGDHGSADHLNVGDRLARRQVALVRGGDDSNPPAASHQALGDKSRVLCQAADVGRVIGESNDGVPGARHGSSAPGADHDAHAVGCRRHRDGMCVARWVTAGRSGSVMVTVAAANSTTTVGIGCSFRNVADPTRLWPPAPMSGVKFRARRRRWWEAADTDSP